MEKRDKERSLILENLRRKLRGEPEYFSCKNYGHFARDCPFSCTLCGKSVLFRKQCTRNKSEPRMITFSVHDQESSTYDMYKKTAFINGRRVTARLNTGSSSCLLK
ncbi:hypothetical protein NPIL_638051 [Nephila pilipes]|uniref:CCHC-type domain-containing protein n=1 Tax=Nephila pilipes TaxID=299642 RepID=A0A8X6P4P4_NEPPI|nr:hypothetical protein NPIL_638051 [Nephila pilipes]